MRSRADTATLRLLRNSEMDQATGCRVWKASRNEHGYGVTAVMTKSWLAHRLSYQEFVGPIPEGLHVLHRCDNPACIEPLHLFIGTDLDNARDRDSKGRRVSANARKTHCKHGHSFAQHGFISSVKVRQCRICVRNRNKAHYHKTKRTTAAPKEGSCSSSKTRTY